LLLVTRGAFWDDEWPRQQGESPKGKKDNRMKDDRPRLLEDERSFAMKCLLAILFLAIAASGLLLIYLVPLLVPLLVQGKLSFRGGALLAVDLTVCLGASVLRWRITGRAPWA
jgi:hypothetical protein